MYQIIWESKAYPGYYFIFLKDNLFNGQGQIYFETFASAEEIGQLLGGN